MRKCRHSTEHKHRHHVMIKMYANRMWTSALVIGALTVAAAASEMDPTPVVSEAKTAIQPAAQNNPNVIVVKVDENGKETYYAGKTTVSKDAVQDKSSSADDVIAEIVSDKNLITKPGAQSKDEMDQTTSTPQWFYIGFGGLGVGIGWAPSYYWYSHTYYPTYYYRPVRHYYPVYSRPYWHPRCHYRFYWC